MASFSSFWRCADFANFDIWRRSRAAKDRFQRVAREGFSINGSSISGSIVSMVFSPFVIIWRRAGGNDPQAGISRSTGFQDRVMNLHESLSIIWYPWSGLNRRWTRFKLDASTFGLHGHNIFRINFLLRVLPFHQCPSVSWWGTQDSNLDLDLPMIC